MAGVWRGRGAGRPSVSAARRDETASNKGLAPHSLARGEGASEATPGPHRTVVAAAKIVRFVN